MQFLAVFITTPNIKIAKKITSSLLDKRLIACSNIIESVESVFWWNGKKDSAKEALLMLKTKKASFKKLVKLVTSIHPYDVPEIIAFPIIAASSDYLKWIKKEVG